MPPKTSDLLLIQKFILLLDDFHYGQYVCGLQRANASLSLKLADEIRTKLPNFDTLDTLCKKIYGGTQKAQKLSFNQLSSYSFRLSHILALNYPAYLLPNFARLQQQVNQGQAAEASMLAEVLLEIAGRVEDFQTQIMVLKFLTQSAFLRRANAEALKLQAALDAVAENESLYLQMLSLLNKTKTRTDLAKNAIDLENIKAFYNLHSNHPSVSIRIFSQYAYLHCVYQYESSAFDAPEDIERVKALQKEIKAHPYLVFPFLTDIKGNIDYWELNSIIHLSVSEDWQPFEELAGHYDSVKFWKSFTNTGRINLLTTAGSRFLTRYHNFVHRHDYHKVIDPDDLKYMRSAIAQCEELLQQYDDADKTDHNNLTLKIIYGILLVLAGGDQVKKGIAELEALLISYQQVNLQSSTGGIYYGLIVGYFSVKDYPKCFKTYARFERAIKDKSVYHGNRLKIVAYYYLAKWLFTGSKQYSRKMTELLRPFEKDNMLPRSIIELVHHFKMPIGLYYDAVELSKGRR
jgi:hypothetical protein